LVTEYAKLSSDEKDIAILWDFWNHPSDPFRNPSSQEGRALL
jgi:hypothetical protein